MPSQEDYLDNLLKDMADKEQREEQEQKEVKEQDFALDLDAINDIGEDEIEKLLSAGAQQEENNLYGVSDMDLPDEDVLKMLGESDDSDLQEIQELLEKSDRNEAVDSSIEDMLRAAPEEEDLEEKIFGEALPEETPENKRETLRIKREQKREQAAAKRAEKKEAREQAKKAAQEAKTAKRAEKAAKKRRKENTVSDIVPEETAAGRQPESNEEDLFDMSVLDSIVSEADDIPEENEDRDVESKEDTLAESSFDSSNYSEPVDVFAQEIEETPVKETDNGEEADDFGIDLGSLFGGENTDELLNTGEADEKSDFPDFLALDADEADALIPNRDKEPDVEEATNKKKSFFSRIFDFLTEEDEEEENENIHLSQENQDILNEIDSEEEKNKKGKKAKKAKEKKEKKEKPKKEAKPKKESKPKKEKPPKKEPAFQEKRLSFKKVLPVVLVGISVGVLLFVFVNSVSDYTDKKEARTAYYQGDYQSCYQNLFGKELDETESIMFGKSESILYIRLWLREYEMFAEEGSEVEALDSLIQTVSDYPKLYAYASQWNAEDEVAEGYAVILNILSDKYGLTENEALEIAAEPNDVEYTRMVTDIARGKAYESEKESEEKEPEQLPDETEETIQDMLPEEAELGNDTFIDNRKDGEPEE